MEGPSHTMIERYKGLANISVESRGADLVDPRDPWVGAGQKRLLRGPVQSANWE